METNLMEVEPVPYPLNYMQFCKYDNWKDPLAEATIKDLKEVGNDTGILGGTPAGKI